MVAHGGNTSYIASLVKKTIFHSFSVTAGNWQFCNFTLFLLVCMYVICYTYTMKNPTDPDSNLRQRFVHQFEKLWPAIKGSLTEVRKPCIRPNCPACARGDKHPAFILSFTDKGRRRCMYVPAELVPQLRQALRNGKALEALLYQLGPELLRRYRKERDAPTTN